MNIVVHEFNTTTKCMELLDKGRVSGVAALELAADTILKKIFTKIIKIKPALKTKVYHLMLSHQFIKKYPKFSKVIWDTIAQVRESEEMKMINKKSYIDEIKLPILCCVGKKDFVVSQQQVAIWADNCKNCRLEELDGCAHEILRETDEVQKKFWSFFDEHITQF